MLNTIEHKGIFFLPDNPNETLNGTLKFNLDDGVELDLFGHFDKFENPSSKETTIVLGITANGKKVTLLNCYQKSGRISVPGFSQSKISAIYLFIGCHFNALDDIEFDSCSLEFEGINGWLNITGFDKPNYNKEKKEYSIKYKTPDNIDVVFFENWEAEFWFDFYAPGEYFTPTEVHLHQRPILKLLPKHPSKFKDFQNVITTFTSFLTVNYFSYPLTKSVIFYKKIEKENEYDSGFDEIELHHPTEIDINKYKNHNNKTDYLIQYSQYQTQFQQIVQNWFALYNQIEVSINILTECFMERSKPAELHFISLTQALENLHKRCFVSTKMDFLDRMNAIVDYLPEKVKKALLENEVDFTKRIRDNRNYYTHYSDTYKLKAVSLGELFMISEKLKIILLTSVLKKISFTETEVEKLVFSKGIYLFNHLIKIPKANVDLNSGSAK